MASTEVLDRQPKVSTITSPTIVIGWSETQLAEYFARSAAPPVLATVETSARWWIEAVHRIGLGQGQLWGSGRDIII